MQVLLDLLMIAQNSQLSFGTFPGYFNQCMCALHLRIFKKPKIQQKFPSQGKKMQLRLHPFYQKILVSEFSYLYLEDLDTRIFW